MPLMTLTQLDNKFGQVIPIKLTQEIHPAITKNELNSKGSAKANTQVNTIEGLDGLKIVHPLCNAQVSLHGGQVLSFTPSGHKDLLWLSKQSSYQNGKAIRGGIPICWPWFGENNKKTSEQKADKHGFARQLLWQVEEIKADSSGITLILILTGDNQHPLWPNAYKLTQSLFFGKTLKQTLSMTNLSQYDAQYTAALHSYFAVSNPNNITIDSLTGALYSDKLTGFSTYQQDGLSCVGEIDRVYHLNKNMTIVDNQWQRKIEIISSHCQQWVLWNPGITLARTMVDVHAGGEQEYVCLEAAITSWQDLPVGKTVTIEQEISVENL